MRRLLLLAGLALLTAPLTALLTAPWASTALAQETVLEATPRQDWRLRGSIAEVVSFLATHAHRPLRLDPRLSGRVELALRDATWREALQAAAAQVGAGLLEDAQGVLSVAPGVIPSPWELVPGPVAIDEGPLAEVEGGGDATDFPLGWLTKQQSHEGSWEPGPDAAFAPGEGRVALTSLALLAIVGKGHTHRFGTHKASVNRGLQAMKRMQDERGGFGAEPDGTAPHLAQALATQAMSELYAVSRDFTLKRYAGAAVVALRGLQQPGGGWAFGPNQAPNTFVTTHAVLALKAAHTAGVDVPKRSFELADGFLARATDADGLTGFYAPGDGISLCLGALDEAPRVPLFSAGASIARVFCGRKRKELRPNFQKLIVPRRNLLEPAYWYLGTYGAFQQGGLEWTVWSPLMLATVLPLQREDGSWRPMGLWGQLGGATATTAMCVLTLEIYYRYERVQERD